jgi:hypothetical protein
MKPVIWLRAASALTLLHGVMHTIGGVFGKHEPGPQTIAVAAMKMNQFPVMGHIRSFWDFYTGFGFGVSIDLFVEAVVFWQLSSLARTDSFRLRPIYWTFLLAYLALAVNSYRYFFPPPVIGELLIALCLGMAIASSKRPALVPA